jgi:hypothetical protein
MASETAVIIAEEVAGIVAKGNRPQTGAIKVGAAHRIERGKGYYKDPLVAKRLV